MPQTMKSPFFRVPDPVSTGITYSVEVEGNAADDDLQSLVDHVDAIAEIPNSLRNGTTVGLSSTTVKGTA